MNSNEFALLSHTYPPDDMRIDYFHINWQGFILLASPSGVCVFDCVGLRLPSVAANEHANNPKLCQCSTAYHYGTAAFLFSFSQDTVIIINANFLGQQYVLRHTVHFGYIADVCISLKSLQVGWSLLRHLGETWAV